MKPVAPAAPISDQLRTKIAAKCPPSSFPIRLPSINSSNWLETTLTPANAAPVSEQASSDGAFESFVLVKRWIFNKTIRDLDFKVQDIEELPMRGFRTELLV